MLDSWSPDVHLEKQHLQERLAAAEQQLASTKEQLASTEKQLAAAEASNASLEAQLEVLKQQLDALEKKLAKARRSGKRQSAPFRRQQRSSNPKAPGRKSGHPGSHRTRPDRVDQTLHAPTLECCPECRGGVEDVKDLENFQTELPPTTPRITRFVFQSAWCPCCAKRVYSIHPEQSSTATGACGHHLGPRLRALVADLKSRLGLSFRKIETLLADFFGITVSPGALVHSNTRLAEAADPTLEAMKAALSQEALVHADETSWWIASKGAWLWVICSKRFTIYVITSNRLATVVREILGEDFEGVLMRDGMASYDAQLSYSMLRCLLHLKRNTKELEEAQRGSAVETPRLFLYWLAAVFELRNQAEELGTETYKEHAEELVDWLDWFLARRYTNARNRAFVQRLALRRDQLIPILEDPQLPATNNLAERQIRPMVLHRKVAAGNKTERGAETLSKLASLAVSCAQQGVSFLDVMCQILLGAKDQPVVFWQTIVDPSPT